MAPLDIDRYVVYMRLHANVAPGARSVENWRSFFEIAQTYPMTSAIANSPYFYTRISAHKLSKGSGFVNSFALCRIEIQKEETSRFTNRSNGHLIEQMTAIRADPARLTRFTAQEQLLLDSDNIFEQWALIVTWEWRQAVIELAPALAGTIATALGVRIVNGSIGGTLVTSGDELRVSDFYEKAATAAARSYLAANANVWYREG